MESSDSQRLSCKSQGCCSDHLESGPAQHVFEWGGGGGGGLESQTSKMRQLGRGYGGIHPRKILTFNSSQMLRNAIKIKQRNSSDFQKSLKCFQTCVCYFSGSLL